MDGKISPKFKFSTTKSKFSSAYSFAKQYPQQSSNGRREFRVVERGQDGNDSASFHGQSASFDNTSHTSHSKFKSNEHVNKSIAQDFEYPDASRESLPSQIASQIATPDNEQPASPVVSEIDDRNDSVADPRAHARRGVSDSVPSRTRYDCTFP